MKIEIITTKKKLTKQLISQMRFPSLDILKQGKVLGFLINVEKYVSKTILIEYKDDYFTIASTWIKREFSVYRKFGKWHQSKIFDSIELCNEWWEVYQSIVEKANMQIYI